MSTRTQVRWAGLPESADPDPAAAVAPPDADGHRTLTATGAGPPR
jgi:hypothetical protein